MKRRQPEVDMNRLVEAARAVRAEPPALADWAAGLDRAATWPDWAEVLRSENWPCYEWAGRKHHLLLPRSWLYALARKLGLPCPAVVRWRLVERHGGKRGPRRRTPEDARNRSILCNELEYRVLMDVLWKLRDNTKPVWKVRGNEGPVEVTGGSSSAVTVDQ